MSPAFCLLRVEAGVAVLAGTDLGLAHGDVAREAALLKSYGLIGSGGSRRGHRRRPIATSVIPFLTPGASADVVLFDGDPNDDVAELQRPVAAMRAGRVIFDHAGAFGPNV